MRAVRLLALFLVYGGLGWMGDQAMAALTDGGSREARPVARVDVRVDPEIEVEVQVRTDGACAFALDRRVSVDLAEGGTLSIAAGAGSLRVEGRPDVDGIEAVGRACASTAELLEQLQLIAETDGPHVSLSAHDRDGPRWGRNQTARIDLVVTVPIGTPLDIADSSGEIVVEGSGDLSIADSSGEIVVRGARGSVRIADGSGDILVEEAAGDLEISDGSGGIEVVGVLGSVAVRDGSGSIDIRRVDADVLIEADGSGSIDVHDVAGDFSVDRDGSGGISYSGVVGRVDIPERRGGR